MPGRTRRRWRRCRARWCRCYRRPAGRCRIRLILSEAGGRRQDMTTEAPEAAPSRPPEGGEGPLETAVLFMDLVASSEFASVLGLEEYAKYVDSFEQLCREQCAYFFEVLHKNKGWKLGLDYEFQFVGDELAVFMHTDPRRQFGRRLATGAPTAELAAG